MFKSCKYCGRIHDEKFECESKKKTIVKRWNNRDKTRACCFRRTNDWTLKSREIRNRDKYSCLCCKAKLTGTTKQYNSFNLSVHHIVPIEEDYEMKQIL